MLKVKDSEGNYKTCRGLLDSASQSNFITQKFAKSLNLTATEAKTFISGLGNTNYSSSQEVDIAFKSLRENYNGTATCKVVPTITGELPSINFNPAILNIPSNKQLADPAFCKPGSIDILFGTSIFFSSLSIGQIKLAKETFLQKTQFGWVATGPVNINNKTETKAFCSLNNINMQNQISKFWEIEGFDEHKLPIQESEHPCESHFKQNTTRAPNGQFVVKIPFRENINLGNSYEIAKNRLISTEKRLAKNIALKTRYTNFMNEYEQLGHMTKLNQINNSSISYYPIILSLRKIVLRLSFELCLTVHVHQTMALR